MPPELLRAEGASPASMTARAVLRCERFADRNVVTGVRSEGALVLRPTRPKGHEPWARRSPGFARMSLAAGAAGPLGGDRLSLEVHVGAGAELVLNEISATLALPGTRAETSVMTCSVRVDEGATLIWLAEPVIAARGCDHRQLVHVELAESARFHVREQLIVGRHGEAPGNIEQRLRVTRGGTAIYDQRLALGPRHAGWDSVSVTEGAKAVGSLLVVDPFSTIGAGRSDRIGDGAVSVGLADDVVQATAVAPDSLALGLALDEALQRLGSPWARDADRAAGPFHTQR